MIYLNLTHGIPKSAWGNNSPIYHYTDASGLLGIISTNRLWATDINFLNDPSEGQLFPERVIDFMRQKPSGLTPLEARIVEGIAARLANKAGIVRTFSVSFCGNGDLLSQWRGYGSFGSGYAVGFEPKYMPHPQLGHLVEVRYDFDAGIQDMALDLLSIYVEASAKWDSVLEGFFDEAANTILDLSLCFKDESYREECETRILARPHDKQDDLCKVEAPLGFRARGADIVPYINLAIDHMRPTDKQPPLLPIRRIVTGPGVDYHRNKLSLERLLAAHGYHGVEIAPSAIPFRP